MRRALLLAVPLTLLVMPLAAQTTGQGGTSSLNPLGQGLAYPQGTVNPNLMPRPGANSAVGGTSGSQAIPNPDGGLPSGAAAADGQQPGASRGGGGRGGGGGGGLAPGVTPVPSAGRGGGGGGGSASGAFTASGGGGRSGGGARGNTGTGNTAGSVPVGHAAQWVLCPDDDSEIAAELGGGMSCAP
jgi:hypothetical protein